jgi:hypothetical protein
MKNIGIHSFVKKMVSWCSEVMPMYKHMQNFHNCYCTEEWRILRDSVTCTFKKEYISIFTTHAVLSMAETPAKNSAQRSVLRWGSLNTWWYEHKELPLLGQKNSHLVVHSWFGTHKSKFIHKKRNSKQWYPPNTYNIQRDHTSVILSS